MNRSRVRLIALIVLVLGLGTAEGIYWIGERAAEKAGTPDSEEIANSIRLQGQRKSDREIEMQFGSVYVLMIHAEDWWSDLPGYKKTAFGLAGATLLVAASCFILAMQLPEISHLANTP